MSTIINQPPPLHQYSLLWVVTPSATFHEKFLDYAAPIHSVWVIQGHRSAGASLQLLHYHLFCSSSCYHGNNTSYQWNEDTSFNFDPITMHSPVIKLMYKPIPPPAFSFPSLLSWRLFITRVLRRCHFRWQWCHCWPQPHGQLMELSFTISMYRSVCCICSGP